MLLTITTTREAATDLGFLLHKHPGRVQAFDVSVGSAHVFYPEAGEGRCTAALLLEVDPIGLVRGRTGPAREGFTLGQYVNDRPYAASSLLSVALGRVFRRLRLERMPERQRERLRLFQSSLTYRDERLAGLDAAVLMEVIEHVDPPRLAALERVLFGEAAPVTIVVTTPNVEHNVRFEGLASGAFRHRDHRFEWTRTEFQEWAGRVAGQWAYEVRFLPVGADDPEVGPPTQMAVFRRVGEHREAAS
ncbi:MAG: hypothetical protein M3P96_10240 [Actinomycetota bacterium]|nr:hypothetical protein [Actinomycetota bacterium]